MKPCADLLAIRNMGIQLRGRIDDEGFANMRVKTKARFDKTCSLNPTV